MLKEREFIRELFAEELAEGEAHAAARGAEQAARHMLLRQLQECFGELPPATRVLVEEMDLAECEETGVRLMRASSLEELGLLGIGSQNS